MKRESFYKKRVYPVVFMLAVTLGFVSVTSAVYTFTADRIRLNERLELKRAVLFAAGGAVPGDPGAIDRAFDSRVKEIKGADGSTRYYEVSGEGSKDIESYVVVYTGAGLWGDITISLGLDTGLESYRGLEIIDQNETPGLGGRIDEKWFKEQFRGKRPPLVSVPEEDAAGESEFNSITGATYSTAALKDIMAAALDYARKEIRGSGGAGE